jgi:hypothetical protein
MYVLRDLVSVFDSLLELLPPLLLSPLEFGEDEEPDDDDDWDEEDFGTPMPKQEDFSLEAIKKARSGKYWLGTLFAPYSQYAGLIPNELLLQEVKK